ncbi:hypothetical protein Trydic_g1998 [Trypoxylus dichotomus]
MGVQRIPVRQEHHHTPRRLMNFIWTIATRVRATDHPNSLVSTSPACPGNSPALITDSEQSGLTNSTIAEHNPRLVTQHPISSSTIKVTRVEGASKVAGDSSEYHRDQALNGFPTPSKRIRPRRKWIE